MHGQKTRRKSAKNKQVFVQAHIFTLITMVKSKLDSRRGGKVYVAFIDYKKASDTVD